MLNRFFAAAVIGGFAAFPMAASADPAPARVISVANAPVAITRCTYDVGGFGDAYVNVTNRSSHRLISLTVQFRFFDEEGAIGEGFLSASPRELLASGDSASFSDGNFNHLFSEPVAAFRYATCRIASATFIGGRKWLYGQTFSEKLLPVSLDRSSPPAMSDSNALRSSPQDNGYAGTLSGLPPSLIVKLGQSWVTNVPSNEPNSGCFVHVRVTLAAPGAIQVSPSEFRINMTLANGATKAYSPLQQAAPRVLRGGLLTYTGDPSDLSPSIAPAEDFGAIGPMSLQPNVPVATILTYQIDQMAPSDTVHIALIR